MSTALDTVPAACQRPSQRDRRNRRLQAGHSDLNGADPIHFGFVVENSSLRDLTDVALFDRVLDGSLPHSWGRHGPTPRGFTVPSPQSIEGFFPEGSLVTRTTQLDGAVEVMVEGEGFVAELFLSAGWMVTRVAADSPERSRQVGESIVLSVPKGHERLGEGNMRVAVWSVGRSGPRTTEALIVAPVWEDVARNYARRTRAALDGLMRLHPGADRELRARLILFHGPPGTGKSSAVRTLARSWAPWCEVEVLADPERALNDVPYLLELTAADSDDRGNGRYRLLVIEDADHHVQTQMQRGDPKIGRLLNIADGILGQDRLLVLLTTNTPASRMHPALVRAGRCLADIGFSNFSPDEARTWLGDDLREPRFEMSLADLYERRGELLRIRTTADVVTTGYL